MSGEGHAHHSQGVDARGQPLRTHREQPSPRPLVCFVFCGARYRNQGVACVKQVLCHWHTIPAQKGNTQVQSWKGKSRVKSWWRQEDGKSRPGPHSEILWQINKWNPRSIFFWLKQEAVAGQIGERLQSSSSGSILAPPPGYLCCLLNEHCLEALCDWWLRLRACMAVTCLDHLDCPTPPSSHTSPLCLPLSPLKRPSSRASCCCTGAQGSRVPSFSLFSFLLAIYNKLHLLWPINVIYLNSQEPQSYWFGVTLVANELSRVLSP